MATRMGLDCYNGNSIHVYSYDANNPHSLFCNNVRQVVGDGKHTIYLSCSEGVACLDVHTRRFTTLHRSGNMSICYSDALYMSDIVVSESTRRSRSSPSSIDLWSRP